MAIGRQSKAGGPVCPNHRCVLLSTGAKPGPGRKVAMQCPISSAIFDVEVENDESKVVYDKFGAPMKTYLVAGEEP